MRCILMFLFLSGCTLLTSQEVAVKNLPSIIALPDARLYEAFDSTYLSKIGQSNPTLIKRLNFYLDNAWYITVFSKEKGHIEDLKTVSIADPERFNIFMVEKNQKLGRDWDRLTFYRINNSDQVLVYYSGKEFMKRFNESLK